MDMGTGLVRAVVVLILSAWAAPLFSQGCPITITGASFSPSLRLMTFNAAIQVFPGDTEDLFGMSFEQRAALIADRVKAEDPDVVLLTEVNQDDSKWVMMDHLQDTFPSYMHVLDADNLLNDSGMMLFSKYVFLTGGGLKSVNGHAGGENQGQHFDFSWVLFSGEDSNGGDYWANKGVGMVRIDNECFPGEVFYVAFTHTQADGSTTQPAGAAAEDFEDRQAQLGKVREVIEATVPPGRRLRDPVFLMGDLNVNGNRFIAPPPLVPFWSGASWEERPWTEWQY
ncbi:MAG: endonuclease/exonuclease/phosphatase family protein, partial [Acidobacteriota bacterium]